MRGALLLAAGALAWSLAGGSAAAASLTVQIENLRNTEGEVHIGLWNTPDGFTKKEQVLVGGAVPASQGSALIFENLPPGRYAIAVYHDENGNGHFDRDWIGLPKEGLAFSNGAWISLGPPSFDDAAFTVDEPSASVSVSLRY